MNDQQLNSPPGGRDVAGAWLVCALIAVLALGLASDFHGGMPPAASMVTQMQCPPASSGVCRPSADVARGGLGTVAGVRRSVQPEPLVVKHDHHG
jgi:hypothetical protein